MTIKLRHVSNFLRVVKLHDDKNKSPEKEVKKTFDLQPVIENTYQNYNEFKKFCLDVEILKLKKNPFGNFINLDNLRLYQMEVGILMILKIQRIFQKKLKVMPIKNLIPKNLEI